MDLMYLVVGIVLLGSALIDVLWTTLWPDGGSGPLSGPLTTVIWRATRQVGRAWERALSLGGPLALVATLTMWISMLWAGWVFVFRSDPGSLVPSTGTGVSWIDRIYFVAYSMFTMGNGDFSPAPGWPQLATSITTATGMVIVTLSITYLLSIIPAVAQKRAFAESVTGLGGRPADVVTTAWNGRDFHALDMALTSLSSELGVLADKHKAFPVLHYYHAADRGDASAVAVALLDEALTILDCGVTVDGVNPVAFRSMRASIDGYLSTLHSAYLTPATDAPPPPDLGPILEAGIPTLEQEVFAAEVDALADRRRRLLGVVNGDAWDWRA